VARLKIIWQIRVGLRPRSLLLAVWYTGAVTKNHGVGQRSHGGHWYVAYWVTLIIPVHYCRQARVGSEPMCVPKLPHWHVIHLVDNVSWPSRPIVGRVPSRRTSFARPPNHARWWGPVVVRIPADATSSEVSLRPNNPSPPDTFPDPPLRARACRFEPEIYMAHSSWVFTLQSTFGLSFFIFTVSRFPRKVKKFRELSLSRLARTFYHYFPSSLIVFSHCPSTVFCIIMDYD